MTAYCYKIELVRCLTLPNRLILDFVPLFCYKFELVRSQIPKTGAILPHMGLKSSYSTVFWSVSGIRDRTSSNL